MPRPKSSGNSREMNIRKIVQEELAEELEEKRAISQYENKSINTVIPSGDVLLNENNFFDILAPITQVANTRADTGAPGGAYGFRVGDEIMLKSVKIKGMVYLNDLTSAQAENTCVGVRVMILKQKDKNSYAGFRADAHTNKLLLDTVGASGYQGPGPFNGSPLDLRREINRNEYSVRYDKTFYLSRDFIQGTSTTTRYATSSNNSLRFFEHDLTFGNGKKLSFTDGASTTPNQFPYLLVVGQAGMKDPTTSIQDGLAAISVSSTAIYTDA